MIITKESSYEDITAFLYSVKGTSEVYFECGHCGKVSKRTSSKIRKALNVNNSTLLFCCRKCQYSWFGERTAKVKTVVQCANCGKDTTNPRFCSRSCAAIVTNKECQKKKRKPAPKCLDCESPAKDHRSLRCAKHQKIHQDQMRIAYRGTKIGEYRNLMSVKNKHPSWINSHVRQFARSWNKEIVDSPCEKCGYSKHVELAHIKAVSEFDDDATLWQVNNPSNIVGLCPNCHWEFDNLDREPFGFILEAKELLANTLEIESNIT